MVGTSGQYLLYWARPVLRHWHAGRWLSPKVPAWLDGSKVGGWINRFEAVGGSSPSDVWALGEFDLVNETVVRAVHWDGHRWAKAAVASQGSFAPQITSVLPAGRSGAWAFGCYCAASQSPYIARFSHGRWHDVTPRGLPFGGIWTASAISASNIWAVMADTNVQSFTVLHWNGSKWSTVRVPASLTSGLRQFTPGGGIVATQRHGVWFAGSLVTSGAAAIVHEIKGRWMLSRLAAPTQMTALIPDGSGGLWSTSRPVGSVSAQIWRYSGGHWRRAADPAGITGFYGITWMAHLPGGHQSLAIGSDLSNELLLSR